MYPIQMTFTVSTPGELARLVAATNDGRVTAAAEIALQQQEHSGGKQEKPEAKKPVVQKESAAATQVTAAASAAPEQKAENSAAQPGSGEPAYTIDDAKELTKKMVSAKGREAAVALLSQFSVPVAAKLEADQVNAFCAAAERVLQS